MTSLSEWADLTYRDQGVRVMALLPGFTKTEFHQRMDVSRELGAVLAVARRRPTGRRGAARPGARADDLGAEQALQGDRGLAKYTPSRPPGPASRDSAASRLLASAAGAPGRIGDLRFRPTVPARPALPTGSVATSRSRRSRPDRRGRRRCMGIGPATKPVRRPRCVTSRVGSAATLSARARCRPATPACAATPRPPRSAGGAAPRAAEPVQGAARRGRVHRQRQRRARLVGLRWPAAGLVVDDHQLGTSVGSGALVDAVDPAPQREPFGGDRHRALHPDRLVLGVERRRRSPRPSGAPAHGAAPSARRRGSRRRARPPRGAGPPPRGCVPRPVGRTTGAAPCAQPRRGCCAPTAGPWLAWVAPGTSSGSGAGSRAT